MIEMLQEWKKTLRGVGAQDLNPEVRFVKTHSKTVTIIRSLTSTGKRGTDARKMATLDFEING